MIPNITSKVMQTAKIHTPLDKGMILLHIEHLLTIFYTVAHQLTRFEIGQKVNRLNG